MRAPRIKVVTLDSEDRERIVFPYWTGYNVSQNVNQLVSKARLVLTPCISVAAREMLAELYAGRKIATFIEGTRVHTGYVEDVETGQDSRSKAPSAIITIADVLGQTVDDSLPDGFQIRDKTVRQVFESVLTRYGIEVVIGNEGNRMAVSQRRVEREVPTTADNDPELARLLAEGQREGGSLVAAQEYAEAHPNTRATQLSETRESRALHPTPGETADAFLTRFARACGLMLWASGDGKAILSAPNWDQRPEFEVVRSWADRSVREGRILSGRLVVQRRAPQEVIVQGRTGRRGQSKIRASARDEEAIYALAWEAGRKYRVHRIIDNSLRSQEDAQRRADTALAQAKLKAKSYDCEVAGHGVRTALYAMDQMVHVYDDCCVQEDGSFLDANLWLVGRSFAQQGRRRMTTSLTFAWPGSWTAGGES